MTLAYVNRIGSASIPAYPFPAIVGQEAMKHAMILAAVDPTIGGVLVLGDRGTGKSTTVRALAGLLPPMRALPGCRFNCEPGRPADVCTHCRAAGAARGRLVPVPVIDLPLGATEDRVAGSLDLERALVKGEKAFEPGLLAAAHRGFLYIDEVNLLDDHIVDLLLDVAASGVNVVEREGISVRHPARFVLIGSGNPEEGELRPQLLDRFGLSVDVGSPRDVATRVEVVRRRDAYDRDPHGFRQRWKLKEGRLRAAIGRAQAALANVATTDDALEHAARLCIALGIDGLRGELTLLRSARAAAAFAGDPAVTRRHVEDVAPAALRHRLRRDPLDEAGSSVRIERALADLREPA